MDYSISQLGLSKDELEAVMQLLEDHPVVNGVEFQRLERRTEGPGHGPTASILIARWLTAGETGRNAMREAVVYDGKAIKLAGTGLE